MFLTSSFVLQECPRQMKFYSNNLATQHLEMTYFVAATCNTKYMYMYYKILVIVLPNTSTRNASPCRIVCACQVVEPIIT